MEKANSSKWRSVTGLIIIYVAMFFNWQWIWGILFLLWVIPDLKSGVTYFLDPVDKRNHPLLYWLIIISWLLMSIYSFSSLIFPNWSN